MFERLHVDVSRWLVLFTAVGSIALLQAPPLHAQPVAFQKAMEAYEAHEYETATDLFSEAAQDSSVEKETRREALRYLGQIYIGRDEREKAREAIERLIRLEPPPVKLDPNRHPPPLMRMYYEVRKEKGAFRGDHCVIEGDKLVLINKARPIDIQLGVLARLLHQLGVENIYVKPRVRKQLEKLWDRLQLT